MQNVQISPVVPLINAPVSPSPAPGENGVMACGQVTFAALVSGVVGKLWTDLAELPPAPNDEEADEAALRPDEGDVLCGDRRDDQPDLIHLTQGQTSELSEVTPSGALLHIATNMTDATPANDQTKADTPDFCVNHLNYLKEIHQAEPRIPPLPKDLKPEKLLPSVAVNGAQIRPLSPDFFPVSAEESPELRTSAPQTDTARMRWLADVKDPAPALSSSANGLERTPLPQGEAQVSTADTVSAPQPEVRPIRSHVEANFTRAPTLLSTAILPQPETGRTNRLGVEANFPLPQPLTAPNPALQTMAGMSAPVVSAIEISTGSSASDFEASQSVDARPAASLSGSWSGAEVLNEAGIVTDHPPPRNVRGDGRSEHSPVVYAPEVTEWGADAPLGNMPMEQAKTETLFDGRPEIYTFPPVKFSPAPPETEINLMPTLAARSGTSVSNHEMPQLPGYPTALSPAKTTEGPASEITAASVTLSSEADPADFNQVPVAPPDLGTHSLTAARKIALPPQVPAQITHAIVTNSGPVSELRLSPEELGTVRIELRAEADRVVATLLAERPETLDLLRRNADRLVAEFRSAGFSEMSLGFGHLASGGQEASQQNDMTPMPGQAEADLSGRVEGRISQLSRLAASAALYLRL